MPLVLPTRCRLPYAHHLHALRDGVCDGSPQPVDPHDPDDLQDAAHERGFYDTDVPETFPDYRDEWSAR